MDNVPLRIYEASLAHLRDSIDALNREYEAKALKLSSSIQTLQLRVDETILSEGDMPTPGLLSLRDQLNGRHLRFPFLRAPHPEYDVAPCPQLLSETDPDYTKVDPAGANAYCSMPDLDRQNEHGDLAVKADGGEEEEDEDAEIVLSFVHVGRDDMYQSTIATIGASVEVARADSALLVPTDLPTPAPSSAPTSSPTDTPTPAPSSAPASSMGQPIFFFVGDIGIEDGARISAGAKFTKTWRLRNDGSDPWPQPLQLMHTGGGLDCVNVAVAVPPALPGQFVDVSVALQVPQTAQGKVVSNWCLRSTDDKGCRTAHLSLWVEIAVAPAVDRSESQLAEANGSEAAAIERMAMMGFGRKESELALLVCAHDVDTAVRELLRNLSFEPAACTDRAGSFHSPAPRTAPCSDGSALEPEWMAHARVLADMGFPMHHARTALLDSHGDLDAAVGALLRTL